MKRKVLPVQDGAICLWMGCEGPATHEVVNIAGETEAYGCEFHAHAFRRHQESQDGAKTRHPSN